MQESQGHPTDRFGGISVRKIPNRLKFSVREMSSRAFLINAFCFRRDKNDVLGTKIRQLARIFGKAIRPKSFKSTPDSLKQRFKAFGRKPSFVPLEFFKSVNPNALTSNRNIICLTAGPVTSCKEQYDKHK